MERIKPLSCKIHDYIEIACLYSYEVILLLADGTTLQGVPITTQTRSDKSEWLEFKTEESREMIRLTDIKLMTAVTKNRFFEEITFDVL